MLGLYLTVSLTNYYSIETILKFFQLNFLKAKPIIH